MCARARPIKPLDAELIEVRSLRPIGPCLVQDDTRAVASKGYGWEVPLTVAKNAINHHTG